MSKGGYIGYTYQQEVTYLFLAKMDVERVIDSVESEAKATHNFEDVIISSQEAVYCIQTKDFAEVKLSSLECNADNLIIGGKAHKLSNHVNVVFFKHIDITPNTDLLGFPAYRYRDIYIISMSRDDIDLAIDKLYEADPARRGVINNFFHNKLDHRSWEIHKRDLPTIHVFSNELIEPTVMVSREVLEVENLLLIEGKPGVGKSHLVKLLESKIPNTILYRFWISNQDRYKEDRLKYRGFITDLSKRLFSDSMYRDEEKIIEKIAIENKVVILDGLDHVRYGQQT